MRYFVVLAALVLSAVTAFSQPGMGVEQAASKAHKSMARLQMSVGDLKLAEKNYAAAIEAYSKCIKYDPTLPQCYSGRGTAHSMNKNSDAAIADYSEQIKLEPNNYLAHLWRGSEYAVLKKYELAQTDLNMSVKLNSGPENKAGVELAADVNRIVELQKKKKNLEVLSQLLGGKSAILLTQGNSEYTAKEYDKALGTYTKCLLEDGPPESGCWLGRANTNWQKFYLKATAASKTMADLGMQDPLAMNVVNDYGSAIKAGGKNGAIASYYRGRFHHLMKRTAEARSDYNNALTNGLPEKEAGLARQYLAALPTAP